MIYFIPLYLILLAAAFLIYIVIVKKKFAKGIAEVRRTTNYLPNERIELSCINQKHLLISLSLSFVAMATVLWLIATIPQFPDKALIYILYAFFADMLVLHIWRINLVWADKCCIQNKPRVIMAYSVKWYVGGTLQIIHLKTDNGVYILCPTTFSEMMGGYANKQVAQTERINKTEQVTLLESRLIDAGAVKKDFFNYIWVVVLSLVIFATSVIIMLMRIQ